MWHKGYNLWGIETPFRVCSVFLPAAAEVNPAIFQRPHLQIEKPPDLLCFFPLCRRLLLVFPVVPWKPPAILPVGTSSSRQLQLAC
ncbi:hypothetical protein SLEP1_g11637 [Rubroshorea leprosula]|nr:hypothetical protein SLEP1_g11637 [Rubroshorea leprosula]